MILELEDLDRVLHDHWVSFPITTHDSQTTMRGWVQERNRHVSVRYLWSLEIESKLEELIDGSNIGGMTICKIDVSTVITFVACEDAVMQFSRPQTRPVYIRESTPFQTRRFGRWIQQYTV